MTQYALMVWGPTEYGEHGGYDTREEFEAQMRDTGAFNARLEAEGKLVYAQGLAPASTATVVDATGERPILTDGPYVESKEYIAGFWVIEAAHLDEALELAAEGSRACRRKLEVRPMNRL